MIKIKKNYKNSEFVSSQKIGISNFDMGFSLIELMFVIGIIALLSTYILAKYPNFSDKQSLDRAAKGIALSIRDAQIKALATVEFAPSVFPAYGVHFDAAVNDSYIIFADLNNNQRYDGVSEIAQNIKIPTASRIIDLCAYLKTSDPDNCAINDLDIVFKRPEPLIFLKSSSIVPNISDVEIIVQSPKGLQKTVGVWLSGQVFME